MLRCGLVKWVGGWSWRALCEEERGSHDGAKGGGCVDRD
jgi:hypothetical protein